jgi:hypothetical protein
MIHPGWITRPIYWVRKALNLLREVRTAEQRLYSVRDLTAREIATNAATVERYEQKQWSIGNVSEQLQFGKWDAHAAEWSVLRKKNESLWHEVADAYEALRQTQAVRAEPPSSSSLKALARRVAEAEL